MMTADHQRHSEVARADGRGRVLLVTGMSGAGRSTALKTLEDMGYEAFDNLLLSLVPALIESAAADAPAISVGADLRTLGFDIESMLETLDNAVGQTARELEVIFIDCGDEQLERRYTETRRPHPLAGDRPVMEGIRPERRVVSALRDRADLVIDTSHLAAAAIKRLLTGHFAQETDGLRIFITSFAYRLGLPRGADLIFDVRFLNNPHHVPELRPLTGRDPEVATHFEQGPGFLAFFSGLWRRLPLLPCYESEGRTYLTIGIGCTGGRHCSVYVAEWLAAELRTAGSRVALSHRDLAIPSSPAPIPADAPVLAG
jgi:UPF0042 nucleotide-binding protein